MTAQELKNMERRQLRDRLEREYGVASTHPKSGTLFKLAWEYGHSCGISEVESYYSELSKLLDNAGGAS